MAVKPKIDLTPEKTVELLKAVVVARGEDYVYEPPGDNDGGTMCKYWLGEAPSCLVGTVLYRAGITQAALRRFDKYPVGSSVDVIVGDGLLDIDRRSVEILQVAQVAQDTGSSWGVALEKAQKRLENLT